MIEWLGVAVIVMLAATVLEWLSEYFGEIWRIIMNLFPDGKRKRFIDKTVEFNETDNRIIENGADIIGSLFEDGIAETLKRLDAQERIECIMNFADSMAFCYGFGEDEMSVAFFNGDEEETKGYAGYYSEADNCIYLNKSRICAGLRGQYQPENEMQLDWMLTDCIDTVIHEMRHAYQRKAIRLIDNGEDFSAFDIGGRVEVWRENMLHGNYIRPEDDHEGYRKQFVERDASTFAASMLERYEERSAQL